MVSYNLAVYYETGNNDLHHISNTARILMFISSKVNPSLYLSPELLTSTTLTLTSKGHNLYKLQYISLEEVKIVSFQQ